MWPSSIAVFYKNPKWTHWWWPNQYVEYSCMLCAVTCSAFWLICAVMSVGLHILLFKKQKISGSHLSEMILQAWIFVCAGISSWDMEHLGKKEWKISYRFFPATIVGPKSEKAGLRIYFILVGRAGLIYSLFSVLIPLQFILGHLISTRLDLFRVLSVATWWDHTALL